MSFWFAHEDKSYRLSAWHRNDRIEGRCQNVEGEWQNFKATRSTDSQGDQAGQEKEEDKSAPEIGEITFPFNAYGRRILPEKENVIFKNATVWTNEKDGILEETDVLIGDGKIIKIGKGITSKNARLIDASGKHLTCGIIDEHSHIAIYRGVNEGTQAVSAEVRIGDVVNSEDVNIYRQLGGGVTAAQLLHGSANPIGGQSALIKLRWGLTPDEMKIQGADGFIKFALGENVKQSNWGNRHRNRFPQTRMGVEQVFRDAFTRAREYRIQKENKGTSFRPDLELEALNEILASRRFVTCHSYVQSEINMLMKTAEDFGFRINTFTHILEGYKIADKMLDHGAGGSTFSDWWAYKYEVIDAIPYNTAIMQRAGIVTAINSDDAEMGRRLNQEAAKAIKYGGLSEEEAWKTVTLNPAKLLHLDDRMGSINEGKDADLVLWSDNPLSIYARAEQTFVDGICLYSLEENEELEKAILAERMRLINKMLADSNGSGETQGDEEENNRTWHCDDYSDECTGH